MPDQPHKLSRRVQSERPRTPRELQPRFFWGAVTLVIVAAIAAGHQIFPGGAATARTRKNMVQSQLRTRKDLAAKLAGIAVAQKNILAGKRAALLRNVSVGQQPNHGGNFVRMGRRV